MLATPYRVLIADDHVMFREGLRHVLEGSGDFVVVAEAGDAAATMQAVRSVDCDLAVLDLSMPGRSGIDLVRQVHAARPELPILVLTMHAEDQYAVRVLAAGACAYLTKGSRADVLLHALRRLAHGGRFIGDAVAQLLAGTITSPARRPAHEELSDREFQILHALVDGESVSAIAGRMHLSVKTVSSHKTSVLRKLRCENLSALMRYAMAHGIAAGSTPPA